MRAAQQNTHCTHYRHSDDGPHRDENFKPTNHLFGLLTFGRERPPSTEVSFENGDHTHISVAITDHLGRRANRGEQIRLMPRATLLKRSEALLKRQNLEAMGRCGGDAS